MAPTVITPEVLAREAQQLDTYRRDAQRLKDEWAQIFDAFLTEHHDQKSFVDQMTKRRDDQEAEFRSHLVQLYWTDGIKATVPGCSVQLRDVVSYDDVDAVRWCVNNDRLDLLSINKAAFAAVAKAERPSCVSIDKRPVAVVATNLHAAAEGEQLAESRKASS